jgi:hypothetical protein
MFFVDIPRTASTAVRTTYPKLSTAKRPHTRASDVTTVEQKFAVVRNPRDRAVSIYHYANRKASGRLSVEQFRAWSKNPPPCPIGRDLDLSGQQVNWIDEDTILCRYENLENDLVERVGLTRRKIEVRNRSSRLHADWSRYYDLKTFQIIAKRYTLDIAIFEELALRSRLAHPCPLYFKILPRCPSISPASWGGRTGLCCDPGRWLARERSGHVCPTRGHANWAGVGQSGSFPQPERGVRLA